MNGDSIFNYTSYARKQIERLEKLIEKYPNNKILPIVRSFWLNDLLSIQLKYFNRF